ncbi:MAG: DUF4416 family protein [Candidatus Marinimicrobia bacterium]|nr:DUF4416 family protein [Candidatus Neomarinimicrobiota bacterium]
MKTEKPQAVKYFIGALYSDKNLLEQSCAEISSKIGPIDILSNIFPFTSTTYYDEEMGSPIFRRFLSIQRLMSPGRLAELKVLCNDMEDSLAVNGHRKVNLDIGYLDLHKLVLASAKYNGQKIYLDQGIYADLTLAFENGQYHPLENTFPDFKSGLYNEFLLEIRTIYKQQLRTNTGSFST